MKLTLKQKRFADEYIISLNATDAYLKAYPTVKNEAVARSNGSRLLTKANVKDYVDSRMAELNDKAIAKQEEILKYLTTVVRGETTEEVLQGVGKGAQKISRMEVSAGDRIKAAELLGKRYSLWTDKVEVQGDITINIGTDYEDED